MLCGLFGGHLVNPYRRLSKTWALQEESAGITLANLRILSCPRCISPRKDDARFAPGCCRIPLGEISERLSYLRPRRRTGAFSRRLTTSGFSSIKAVDINGTEYAGSVPFAIADLNSEFAVIVKQHFAFLPFDLITAIEVIEHLESPIRFLRQCRELLAPEGTLLITTPNVESTPGRLKFLWSGDLRHFDEHGEPTHITPITSCLLEKAAERAGLVVELRQGFPRVNGYTGTRVWVAALSLLLGRFLQGNVLGDCHLFLLRRKR